MRVAIRTALRGDAALQALQIAADGSNVLAGDVDTPTGRPFLQLRFQDTQPGIVKNGAGPNRRVVQIWVHDEGTDGSGDYTRIDAIISRIRVVLSNLIGTATETGWIVGVDWLGDSDDLADSGHETITRFTTHVVVGSGI